MIRSHEITFPRFAEDILSHKRTLMHILFGYQGEPFRVGDRLLLFNHTTKGHRLPRCPFGTIVSADLIELRLQDSDLPLLNVATVAEYFTRWDALHPEAPAATFPKVWRIEWAYGSLRTDDDPPEWSLAV